METEDVCFSSNSDGEDCLYCSFARVARFHPRRLLLLQVSELITVSYQQNNRSSELGSTGELSDSQVRNPNTVAQVQVSREISDRPQLPIYPGDTSFSYSEIHDIADLLASDIRNTVLQNSDASNVTPDGLKKVAILLSPSVEYVVSVLAVLQCGVAFVPVDPQWPSQRIVQVLSDSSPCLILTRGQTQRLHSESLSCFVNIPVTVVDLKTCHRSSRSESKCRCFCHSGNGRPYCYLMYTSGSTGNPKGVCGTEKGLLCRLQWMQKEYPFLSSDVGIFKTSVAFIDHLTELFGPLLGGSAIIVPAAEKLYRNPLGIIHFLRTYRVNRLTAVPSLMHAVLPVLRNSCPPLPLRVLVLSGETLSITLFESIKMVLPQTTIINLYGTTELSGDCLYFNCGLLKHKWEYPSVPIGKPLPGCVIHISDETFQAADEGELWVGGLYLARGYLNDSLLTSNKFKEYKNERFFKTGDYVKKLTDGNLLFLGRKDRTIKMNGIKVALDEVERNLEMHSLVDRVAVTCHVGENSEHNIIAHVVLKSHDQPPHTEETCEALETSINYPPGIESFFRRWLSERMPAEIVPTMFNILKALPMTGSAKVDYQSLVESVKTHCNTKASDESISEISSLTGHIKAAFQDVLKTNNISVNDNFFALGGTSVSAAHLAHILGIDMRILYSHGSVVALESVIKHSQSTPFQSFKIDDFSLDSRNYKRIKIESSKSNNALHFHESSSFDAHSNDHENSSYPETHSHQWPWVQVKKPMVFLRCNVCVPSKMLQGKVGKNMARKIVLTSISVKDFHVLSVLWKTELEACVDASPVLVIKSWDQCHLFIGSHAHKFVCIDACTGNLIWESTLGDRVESTATVTSDFSQVVVGSYDGFIYFLDYYTGILKWRFQTKGEVKCQPALDALTGHIWCGSHDHCLYVLSALGQRCVWEHDFGGSIFGAPAHDPGRKLIYIATTAGTLTAVRTDVSHCEISWTHKCDGPIFGSPIVDPSSGKIICTLVNGSVVAFTSSGSLAWKYTADGPIFAGASISSMLPSQVLVCCRDGWIYSLDLSDGYCLWKHCVGEPITSAACVDEMLYMIFQETIHCSILFHKYCFLCVCGSSGTVHILKVYAGSVQQEVFNDETKEYVYLADYKGYELVDELTLPGDIFSSPVMVGGRIFVGCRDNNIYCLMLSGLDI